jgi:dihydrolipoamide dehydrogenase
MKIFTTKNLIFVLVVIGIVGIYLSGAQSYLTFENLKAHQSELEIAFQNNSLLVGTMFAALYVITTALSIPGAAILTLAAGSIFGLGIGTAVVSASSTIGATLAFLGARYIFGDIVQNKFNKKLESINQGLQKEGAFYLLSLRLLPIFPFFMINLLLGLTSFGVFRFFIISMIGMLPGTFIYVNAGTQLSKISSAKEILSPAILGSFFLIGLLPIAAKFFVSHYRMQKYTRKFKKPKSFDYNLVVIGGGSAGLVTAFIGAAVKAKTALIEKHKMGGDCLNTGCVPSKALIKSASIFHCIKKSEEYGIESQAPQLRFEKIMERVQNVIKKIEPHDSVERYSQLGVNCIQGEAQILSPFEVQVNGQILKTRNIVIATGASPLVPPIPGLDSVNPSTSENIWNLRKLPKRLLVLGGGPIGCELAQSFARFGSKVIIVEKGDRILAREDEDVSQFITKTFLNEGVDIKTSHEAIRFEKGIESNKIICKNKGSEVVIEFDHILVALGRRANTKGFGLEKLDIEISKSGTIATNERLQTTHYPNIFACGDVTGPFQFTHTASYQAWFAAVNALFSPFKTFKVDYRVIPWCTFTSPEIARVGLNEFEANEQGIDYQVTCYGIDDLDRAITDSVDSGFVKVITKGNSDQILGATIVGAHAGEIIGEYVTAMKFKLGLNKILGTIHIYPTMSEANKYAAGVWKKKNAPQKILKLLTHFHKWRRS